MTEKEIELQNEIDDFKLKNDQLEIDKIDLESEIVDLKYDLRVCEEKKSNLEDTISSLEEQLQESEGGQYQTLNDQIKYDFL